MCARPSGTCSAEARRRGHFGPHARRRSAGSPAAHLKRDIGFFGASFLVLNAVIGAGIAGLAGVALSQIDNVSPNLGQSYIVDSFMVDVTAAFPEITLTGPDTAAEGSPAQLNVRIDDPTRQIGPRRDEWSFIVDWGDGSDPDAVTISAPGVSDDVVRQFTLEHRYLDDD